MIAMDTPGTVRRNADEPTKVAIKTGLDDARAWFIFDLTNGGHYSNGTREAVEGWPKALEWEPMPEEDEDDE